MAYLPFYITPEEFAEKQKQQEQEIASGRNQISWYKYDIEEPNRYHNILMSLVPISLLSVMLGYFWLASGKDAFMGFGSLVLLVFGYGYCYLLFGLDYRYDYQLSELGLVVKKRRNIPRWVNSASQVAAWFGAIVCIFAVSVAGPMILAGAGGLILLSFTGLKRQPDDKAEVRIGHSEDWLFAYYNTQRKVIVLYHKCDHCEYEDVAKTEVVRSQSRSGSYLFFKTVEEMRQVVNTLSQCHQLECCEISNPKSLFGLDGGRPEPLLKIPSRTMFYQKSEVDLLKQKKAPLPDWKYLYQGKFRTKEEITKLQNQPLTAGE
ncbi:MULTISPECIES: hypothetical protein [Vibrio]|uniref:hypothetical protein n=1 Tax=Vibrio TaxID=662 RepID=UPI00207581E6|nr:MULTISPECIES: hypothetical protein [Vibrio]USD32474.1 hypothetical protein J8Z27_14955 [Vibrio sp. SCSIO 43186]USD45516.1 hypothetical protein J4N38_15345 [Vibrio sp. SCSIO 43145]USD69599.1 hypothetical protein J4N41_14965 [Vibrio sp. SCSIO 43139]USD97291.1 hypothetical protein CTT30_15155 [Vibrio coralliilyticus]